MLVVDAAFAVNACLAAGGFPPLGDALVGPPLLWSETRATLHRMAWHGELEPDVAADAHERLLCASVERIDPPGLGRDAWRFADELGWARTYDAEYLALAHILGCRLLTLDRRLRRGAARLGFVIVPEEL